MTETYAPDQSGSGRTVSFNPARVRAVFQGHTIADSTAALTVREPGREEVQYFPVDDVETGYMSDTDLKTRCGWKGEASYKTLLMDGHFAENGVWSYQDPLPEAELLKGYLAFDKSKGIEVYEIEEGREAAPQVPPMDPPYSEALAAEQEQRFQNNVERGAE